MHECHHMVNTKIRLIIFFADRNGEALYGQQKQRWELIVAVSSVAQLFPTLCDPMNPSR